MRGQFRVRRGGDDSPVLEVRIVLYDQHAIGSAAHIEFHGLGTQLPSEIWIAIHVKAWRPRLTGLPVRIVHMSGPALTKGFDVHDVEHVAVRITNAAKTVADCFKFRNKIGLDVALEALREYRRQRLSLDDLHEMARVCRVERVMRPYLEAIL